MPKVTKLRTKILASDFQVKAPVVWILEQRKEEKPESCWAPSQERVAELSLSSPEPGSIPQH